MGKTIEFKSCVGLGDFILMYAFFESIKHEYSRIGICPDKNLISGYRSSSKEMHDFIMDFARCLFDKAPYEILEDSNAYLINPKNLVSLINSDYKVKHISLIDKLPLLDKVDCGTNDYIVINMKARSFDCDVWTSIKPRFIEILKQSKRKIVLLGERNIGNNAEAKLILMYSIYNDLISSGISFIDLTQDELLCKMNMNSLMKDMTILRDAKCSVVFGVSGISQLSVGISNNTLGLRIDDHTDFLDEFISGAGNTLFTYNIESFFTRLEQVCLN